MSEWQPIETAPLDSEVEGSMGVRTAPMILLTDGYYIYIGFWNGRFWDDGDYNSTMTGMTHWMPLPELPK